jgi:mono/diheme cytochrome c family protein
MLKKLLIGLLALVVLAVVGAFAALKSFESKAKARLAQTWTVDAPDVPIPWPLNPMEIEALAKERMAATPDVEYVTEAGVTTPDPLAGVDLDAIALERAVARGEQYLQTRAPCAECHGTDFGGKAIMDNPAMGRWVGPNITKAGVVADYSGADWVRIIRHGVKPDGSTASMPSVDFQSFSDQEVSDIAAALLARPAVAEPAPPTELGPVMTMLVATGEIPLSAELIDHAARRPKTPPEIRVSAELGEHLANTCSGCHGLAFAGGPIVGGDPAWPEAAPIDGAALASITLEQFRAAMVEGTGSDGQPLVVPMSDVVPYTAKMHPDEIESLYLYLKSVGG